MFLPNFLQKVVIVYEERSGDERVEVAAIAIYLMFLAFYCDLTCEIYAGLFKAKFLGAIDGLPFNESHMLPKEIGAWRAFEIIKDEMLGFIGVFDERLEVDAGPMEITIIVKQVFGDPGCPV